MCLISVFPKGVPKDSEFVKSCLISGFKTNGSSGNGLMYLREDENYTIVHVDKGYFSFNTFLDRFESLKFKPGDVVVVHHRIATQGLVNSKNCHPFIADKVLYNEPKCDISFESLDYKLVIAHNGAFRDFGGSTDSDTADWVKSLSDDLDKRRLLWENPVEFNKKYRSEIGNFCRLAIVNSHSSEVKLLSAFENEWIEDQGCYFSNSAYKDSRFRNYGGVDILIDALSSEGLDACDIDYEEVESEESVKTPFSFFIPDDFIPEAFKGNVQSENIETKENTAANANTQSSSNSTNTNVNVFASSSVRQKKQAFYISKTVSKKDLLKYQLPKFRNNQFVFNNPLGFNLLVTVKNFNDFFFVGLVDKGVIETGEVYLLQDYVFEYSKDTYYYLVPQSVKNDTQLEKSAPFYVIGQKKRRVGESLQTSRSNDCRVAIYPIPMLAKYYMEYYDKLFVKLPSKAFYKYVDKLLKNKQGVEKEKINIKGIGSVHYMSLLIFKEQHEASSEPATVFDPMINIATKATLVSESYLRNHNNLPALKNDINPFKEEIEDDDDDMVDRFIKNSSGIYIKNECE